MTMITVKPAKDRLVFMPPVLGRARGEPVPAEGMRVELTSFVRRRLDAEDLIEVKDEPAAPPAASPAPKAASSDEGKAK